MPLEARTSKVVDIPALWPPSQATLENAREEAKRGAVELEQWKAQARLDAMQRAELRAANDDLDVERNTLKEACEALKRDRDALAARLEKATFEADVQVQERKR